MKCPVCYNTDTKVLDSRSASDDLAIRRRRECCKCNFRFSTYESVELLDFTVVKRDLSREAYSRPKLEKGIRRSLEKRQAEEEDIQKLINQIERSIQIEVKKGKSGQEISSQAIGTIAMEELKKIIGQKRKRSEEILEWGDTQNKIINISLLRKVDRVVLKKQENQYFEELVKKLKKEKIPFEII